MSSVSRTFAQPDATTKFLPIRSVCYHDDDIGHTVLIPFSYSNGVLDIDVPTPSAQNMIDSGDTYNAQGFNWRMVKACGGTGLVQELGPNFLTWMAALQGDDFNNPTIQVRGVMTKVRQSVQGTNADYGSGPLNAKYAIVTSSQKPLNEEYIVAGDETNKYFTAWVFKSPLTIKFTRDNGDVQYVTLNTQFQNSAY